MSSLFDLELKSTASFGGAFGVFVPFFLNTSDTDRRQATAGHTSKTRTAAVQNATRRGTEQGKL